MQTNLRDRAAAFTPPDGMSDERRLVDHLRRLGGDKYGIYAVHIHLSRLRLGEREPLVRRLFARAFEALTARYEATVYRLHTGDIVLVCRNVPVDEVDRAVVRLRALVPDDLAAAPRGNTLSDSFSTWFDLSRTADQASLAASVRTLMAEGKCYHQQAAADSPPWALSGRPLDPNALSSIGRRLQGQRIDRLIRQQMAIEIRPGGDGRPLFRETYVSMTELQRRIAPGFNLFGSSCLFRYLTEFLDKQMLTTVPRQGLQGDTHPISLNLNLSSLKTVEFQEFHQSHGSESQRPVIEIQLTDALADVGSFVLARDILRRNGYRILIDGLSPLAPGFVDLRLLEPDYVKICWSSESTGGLSPQRLTEIRAGVDKAGREKVLLARVDSEEAVKWALELGITRFQGRYVDRLIELLPASGAV